ncbi:hypothetical protein C8F04DRAFT_1194377 [Mycena alexandri]|uniref:Uncharacterized protein n=1 Tax=Mycena alexandri TaxID=1745969 RepID=A0AAD6WT52_9AGAR|nr:hypothetical protein C8F04DRAFT_1194377 [Mycena alexandri]
MARVCAVARSALLENEQLLFFYLVSYSHIKSFWNARFFEVYLICPDRGVLWSLEIGCHRRIRRSQLMIEDEMCLLDLEDADSLLEHVEELISMNFEDFPEDRIDDDAARYAAKMTKAKLSAITSPTICGETRNGTRSKWTNKLPGTFITQKCGPIQDGFEGRKYSTAVSTRAALTMWYRSIRPNESLTEWRLDPTTNTWRGLPTRSRHVSQFMVGLEKTKAKSGEVAYLLAWLMLLRIDEIVKLRFENVDKIPGERRYIDVGLNTRKQNQTGLLHSWRLHANDDDPKVCPVRAFILLASLYGPEIRKSGPIFLHVSASGAVMQSQPLCS